MGFLFAFILGSIATFALMYVLDQQKKQQQEAETRSRALGPDGTTTNMTTALTGGKTSYGSMATGAQRSTFFTDIIEQLWDYCNVAICATVKETVEAMFKEMLPAGLKSLHFKKLDLGKVPIKLDNIYVHEVDKKNNVLQFDLDVIWDGECDIKLHADYIGSFGVKSLVLAGRMQFILRPLLDYVPMVGAVQFAFVNPPKLDLDFTGLANVADFAFIDDAIRNVIQNVLAGMIVLPNRMLTKVDPTCDVYDTYHPPVGIARMTVVSGQGFQIEKRTLGKNDVPDVYCKVSLGGDRVFKTTTIKNNTEPEWRERSDFLLCDNDQVVTVEAYDEDTGSMDKDDHLGFAKFTVGEVLLSPGRTKKVELLEKSFKTTNSFVTIRCDIGSLTTEDLLEHHFPPSQRDVSLMAEEDCKNLFCGVVTVFVAGAKDIPQLTDNEENPKDLCSYVKVTYGGKTFQTVIVKPIPDVEVQPIDVLNPVYDAHFKIPLTYDQMLNTSSKDEKIVFSLIRNDGLNKNKEPETLGTTSVDIETVVSEPHNGNLKEAKAMMGDSGASIDYRVVASAIDMSVSTVAPAPVATPAKVEEPAAGDEEPAAPEGEDAGSTPEAPAADFGESLGAPEPAAAASLGKVLLTAVGGRNFPIEKKRFKKKDIPDVYLNVTFGSSPTVWRTSTIKNDCNPTWDESREYTLVDHGQVVCIDAYDEDSGGNDKDDELGSVRIAVGKLLLAGGTKDIELIKKGQPSGSYVTLKCDMVNS